MGYAVHQVLVELTSEAFVAAGSLAGSRLVVGMEYADFFVDDLVDELLGLVDAVGNLGHQNGLAVKARGLHVLVGSDDDTVAVGDLFCGQNVLCTAGAIGLDLYGDAHLVACLGKCLGGHVGVCDTGRASGNCQNAVAARCGSRCSRFFGELLGFLIVNDLQEFGGGFCRLELCGEVLMHEHLHQACQHLEVNVAVECRRDHENELDGCAVGRVIVYAVGNRDGCQRRCLDSFTLCVGNGYLHTDSGGAHILSGENTLFVRRRV